MGEGEEVSCDKSRHWFFVWLSLVCLNYADLHVFVKTRFVACTPELQQQEISEKDAGCTHNSCGFQEQAAHPDNALQGTGKNDDENSVFWD